MQASQDQLSAYFLWLKDRGLRFPVKVEKWATESPPSPVETVKPAVQVVFVSDTVLLPAERELLNKMIGAMQLGGEHRILEQVGALSPFLEGHTVDLIIPLGEIAAAACPSDTIPTLHPRDLLARPDDKRIAWNDLKRAMARLQA